MRRCMLRSSSTTQYVSKIFFYESRHASLMLLHVLRKLLLSLNESCWIISLRISSGNPNIGCNGDDAYCVFSFKREIDGRSRTQAPSRNHQVAQYEGMYLSRWHTPYCEFRVEWDCWRNKRVVVRHYASFFFTPQRDFTKVPLNYIHLRLLRKLLQTYIICTV